MSESAATVTIQNTPIALDRANLVPPLPAGVVRSTLAVDVTAGDVELILDGIVVVGLEDVELVVVLVEPEVIVAFNLKTHFESKVS